MMMSLTSFSQVVSISILIASLDLTTAFFQSYAISSVVQNSHTLSMSSAISSVFVEHKAYLTNVAKAEPPRKLELLLQLLDMTVDEEIVSPSARDGLNPFLVPISRSKADSSMLCYIRWPTQKESMDLQLVRTTDVGIYLVAMGTDQYCHRLAVEQDFYCLPTAVKAIELLNASGQVCRHGTVEMGEIGLVLGLLIIYNFCHKFL